MGEAGEDRVAIYPQSNAGIINLGVDDDRLYVAQRGSIASTIAADGDGQDVVVIGGIVGDTTAGLQLAGGELYVLACARIPFTTHDTAVTDELELVALASGASLGAGETAAVDFNLDNMDGRTVLRSGAVIDDFTYLGAGSIDAVFYSSTSLRADTVPLVGFEVDEAVAVLFHAGATTGAMFIESANRAIHVRAEGDNHFSSFRFNGATFSVSFGNDVTTSELSADGSDNQVAATAAGRSFWQVGANSRLGNVEVTGEAFDLQFGANTNFLTLRVEDTLETDVASVVYSESLDAHRMFVSGNVITVQSASRLIEFVHDADNAAAFEHYFLCGSHGYTIQTDEDFTDGGVVISPTSHFTGIEYGATIAPDAVTVQTKKRRKRSAKGIVEAVKNKFSKRHPSEVPVFDSVIGGNSVTGYCCGVNNCPEGTADCPE